MRVVWTQPARRDLRSHLVFVAERNSSAARKLRATIHEAVERLSDSPHRGRPGRYEGTRELVVVGTPYVVIYRVLETTVQVLRVLHGAQDLGRTSPED